MLTRLLMPLLALLLAGAAPPLPPELNDPSTTEGWIWQQVQKDDVADLNDRCKDDSPWNCHHLDPDLLRALLTQPDLADHTPHGVRIRGARIIGDLDLRDAHVRAAEVWLDVAWIAGDLNLGDAHVDGLLSLDGTRIERQFFGERSIIGSYLSMRGAVFGGPVDLHEAHVEGGMNLDLARVPDKQTFNTEGLHVGSGGLFMRKAHFDGPVILRDVNVESQLAMSGASIAADQPFNAERLHVARGGLFLNHVVFGGPVDLSGAHIEGQLALERASITEKQTIDAENLHVGRDFIARSVMFGGPVDFRGVAVDGDFDLRDSRVRRLDLSLAVVKGDLRLGGDGLWLRWPSLSGQPTCEDPKPCLILRNMAVGNLQDDELAWPSHITLEGFTYGRLGGIGGEQRQDMRNRPIKWWRDWLSRDRVYSSQPYTQLASVLMAAGNREGAADIRFFGRDRERSELLRGCIWLQKLGWVEKPDDGNRPCRWASWLGLSAQQAFVGYGIAGYSFRALICAVVLALIGTAILAYAPGVRITRDSPRPKGPIWCFGASLHRVLPVITISKEFADFFDDPKRERLRNWQHFAFAVLALCGWALAAFVAAAFSGLIQS